MARRLPRILRFVTVGAGCFGLQYLAGLMLVWLGAPWPAANAVGFIASAQLNFLLSSVWTWGDRGTWSDSQAAVIWQRWASYNATALLALAVNTGVFTVTYELVGSLAAAMLGVVAGTAATYLICDLLVFPRAQARAEARARALSLAVRR